MWKNKRTSALHHDQYQCFKKEYCGDEAKNKGDTRKALRDNKLYSIQMTAKSDDYFVDSFYYTILNVLSIQSRMSNEWSLCEIIFRHRLDAIKSSKCLLGHFLKLKVVPGGNYHGCNSEFKGIL